MHGKETVYIHFIKKTGIFVTHGNEYATFVYMYILF